MNDLSSSFITLTFKHLEGYSFFTWQNPWLMMRPQEILVGWINIWTKIVWMKKLVKLFDDFFPPFLLLLSFSPNPNPNSLRPNGLQHTRLPRPSLYSGACSNACPLSQWCHPTISSSVSPFSFCLQSCPASGSFPMSQLFSSGGQSIGASAFFFS